MIADTPGTRELSPADALEVALDWWREAGVDGDYLDDPASWLSESEEKQAVASPKPTKPPEELKQTPLERAFGGVVGKVLIGGPAGTYPKSLERFREWWMSEKSLSQFGPERRSPPRGVAGARLMIVLPEPIETDSDTLLAGAPGRLVEAILSAMGIAAHEIYVASALPAPSPLPDWSEMAKRGLAGVTHHHIALAAPHRILVFGRSLAPLFDVPLELAREDAEVKAGDQTVPLMLAPELAELARSAQRRRNFWNRWLEWTT